MNVFSLVIVAFLLCLTPGFAGAQSDFSIEEYGHFLKASRDLSSGTLLSRHTPGFPYFKSRSLVLTGEYAYLDSVKIKLGLTDSEIDILRRNGFMVSERMSHYSFREGFTQIFNDDLPVFITTDSILQALHGSYDKILMEMEWFRMRQNLNQFLDALSGAYPKLAERYGGEVRMKTPLEDVDLYVTIARSLLAGQQVAPHSASPEAVDAVWQAIQAERITSTPLFTERNRTLDFSQFTVRGHYAYPEYIANLGPYFKCMMWLGRMDFLLTPPPAGGEAPWGRDEIRRMCLDAVLLNELAELSGKRDLLDENDRIITFLVGESDNLTPGGLDEVVRGGKLASAAALLDDTVYDAFQSALLTAPGDGQRILSDLFIMDPFAENPDPLPVSFRLMGQRFTLDSHIFSNVVSDRIVYNGRKIWRPMPNPLDVLFVLGNDDALPLLQSELDTYHYASQLEDLRYLTDHFDTEFWGKSLYNTWLSALRVLNPSKDIAGLPYFMRTAAWRQEKMNTQLASWAQLRHDNILYVKQTYARSGCSFPYSYVEPNPEFYRNISLFVEKADKFFGQYAGDNTPIKKISSFFQQWKEVMDQLGTIARKERQLEPLTDGETEFLKQMLYNNYRHYTDSPVLGWYHDLFYDRDEFYIFGPDIKADFVIADVHTQPTDEYGNVVGKVLHVGTGPINLGVFLVDSPFPDVGPTAFVGPVMSYYEKVTDNFDRLTDARWSDMLIKKEIPPRPDWVNIYLADRQGNACAAGRELPGILPGGVVSVTESSPIPFHLLSVFPNPFNPSTAITFSLPSPGRATLAVYSITGQKIRELVSERLAAGTHMVVWDGRDAGGQAVASGVYISRLEAQGLLGIHKMLLIR